MELSEIQSEEAIWEDTLGLDIPLVDYLATYYHSTKDFESNNFFKTLSNTLKSSRHQLTCNNEELKLLLGQIVTKKWHALHVELLKVPDEKIGHEEFMNLCEQLAPVEFRAVLSESLPSSSNPASLHWTNESANLMDVKRTIAQVLELKHNPNYYTDFKGALLDRKARCVEHLAKVVYKVDFNGATPPNLRKRKRGGTGSERHISDLILSHQDDLNELRTIGLSDFMQKIISSFFPMKKRPEDKAAYVQLVNTLDLDGSPLLSDMGATNVALKALVTWNWYPLYQILCYNKIKSFDFFINICEKYAEKELQVARNLVRQKTLSTITNSGMHLAGRAKYENLSLIIAYVVILHDPLFAIEGVENENYLQNIQSYLKKLARRNMNMVMRELLKLKIVKDENIFVEKHEDKGEELEEGNECKEEVPIEVPMQNITPEEEDNESVPDIDTSHYYPMQETDVSFLEEKYYSAFFNRGQCSALPGVSADGAANAWL